MKMPKSLVLPHQRYLLVTDKGMDALNILLAALVVNELIGQHRVYIVFPGLAFYCFIWLIMLNLGSRKEPH